MNSVINLELTDLLREFVDSKIGAGTLYASPGEFICDLLRQQKLNEDAMKLRDGVLEGYADIAAGRVHEYTGDLQALLAKVKEESP